MNTKAEHIRYHREQMWYWTKALQAAKEAKDENMVRQAIRERREHTNALLSLWATKAEELAVCV